MAKRKRKIGAADLHRIRVPQSVDISPDGKRAVYSVRITDGKNNRYYHRLFRLSTGGGRPTALTTGKANDSEPRWNPRGSAIAFISDREKEVPDIWVIAADGGEATRLTRLGGGPVTGLSWSPDGRALLFLHRSVAKEDEKEKKKKPAYKHLTRLQHKLDGMGWYKGARWRLCVASFPSGRVRVLAGGENDVTGAAWSPDGRRIALLMNDLPDPERDIHMFPSDIYTIGADGKRLRKITRSRGLREGLAWSADGKTIFFKGNHMKPGEWIRHTVPLRRIPAAGGAETVLTPDVTNWTMNMVVTDTLGGFSGPIYRYHDGVEERLAFLHEGEGSCHVWSVSTMGGKMRLELGGDVNVTDFAVASSTGRAAAVIGEMMSAGDIFSFDLDGSTAPPRRLSRLNDAFFNSLDLTEPEEVAFRNGSMRIQGWILKPPGFRKNRKYPCLIEVHGGPMCQYGYTFFHEMHLLAAEGYVVVFSNPRGSSGRGLKYMNCIEGNWGKLDYADIMAVTESMARRRYVDSKRLGILGGSYGGFMTTWAVGHTNRFKAAVTQRALGNWLIQFGASDYGWDLKFELGGAPWEKPLHYLKLSPNYYVARMKTPLLIIQSEHDLRCPAPQALELFTSLKLLGRTTEMVLFEGESHGLSRGGSPANRLERLERIVDWFERYL